MNEIEWTEIERDAAGRALYLRQARMHVHPDDQEETP